MLSILSVCINISDNSSRTQTSWDGDFIWFCQNTVRWSTMKSPKLEWIWIKWVSMCTHEMNKQVEFNELAFIYIEWNTSSTAQGGGGSFKNRKPIGEVGCCESGMAERSHWLTERWLELCLLEWLQWLQWSPHPQLLDVVWCTATVVVVVA